MKELSWLRLSFLFAGCFLGAGYVSGQELWQYFGSFGKLGFLAFFFTLILLFLMGALIMRLSNILQEERVDYLVSPWNSKALRFAVGILENIFIFSIASVMTAGVGSLAERFFGLPSWVGGGAFALLLLVMSFFDFKSVVSAFSVSVPLLAVTAVIFSVIAVKQNGFPEITADSVENQNGLLGNPAVSAVNFACYNMFASIAILSPFGKVAYHKKRTYLGLFGGTVIAGTIAVAVLLSLNVWRQATQAELPMLEAAANLGKGAEYLYGVLLFAAMFGTGLSSLVALNRYCEGFVKNKKTGNRVIPVVTAFSAFLTSRFGFGQLIGFLYPVFGYACAVFVIFMVIKMIRVKKQKKEEGKIS